MASYIYSLDGVLFPLKTEQDLQDTGTTTWQYLYYAYAFSIFGSVDNPLIEIQIIDRPEAFSFWNDNNCAGYNHRSRQTINGQAGGCVRCLRSTIPADANNHHSIGRGETFIAVALLYVVGYVRQHEYSSIL